jgi:hypothetical protein
MNDEVLKQILELLDQTEHADAYLEALPKSEKICQNCDHFMLNSGSSSMWSEWWDDRQKGACHKNAPVQPPPQLSHMPGGVQHFKATWPDTRATLGCGDWAPRSLERRVKEERERIEYLNSMKALETAAERGFLLEKDFFAKFSHTRMIRSLQTDYTRYVVLVLGDLWEAALRLEALLESRKELPKETVLGDGSKVLTRRPTKKALYELTLNYTGPQGFCSVFLKPSMKREVAIQEYLQEPTND